jgi:hypothetical protein
MRHLATLAVIALACVLTVPAIALGWSVTVPISGTVRIERDSSDASGTVYLYGRSNQISASALADGSWDSTAGYSAPQELLFDSSDLSIEYRNTGWVYYLVKLPSADAVVVNVTNGTSMQPIPVYISSGYTNPVSVVGSVALSPTSTVGVSSMPTRTIDVTGTVAVSSLNASLSLPSTLTVTPDEGSASELRLVGVLFCFCLAVWLFVWAFSGRRVTL